METIVLCSTITGASICCMLCLILCTVLSFAIMPNSNYPIYECLCVFTEIILQLVHPWSTCPLCWSIFKQGSEPSTSCRRVLFCRTDLQGSIKFHIILHENINRKWWQSNYESATVKRLWDYRFTRGAELYWTKPIGYWCLSSRFLGIQREKLLPHVFNFPP